MLPTKTLNYLMVPGLIPASSCMVKPVVSEKKLTMFTRPGNTADYPLIATIF